jgi:hypothetical protein
MNTGNHRELEGIGCRPPKEYSAETLAKAVDYGGVTAKGPRLHPRSPKPSGHISIE